MHMDTENAIHTSYIDVHNGNDFDMKNDFRDAICNVLMEDG